MHKFNIETKVKIVNSYNELRNMAKVGKCFEIDRSVVKRVLFEFGILPSNRNKKEFSESEILTIIELYQSNWTLAKIGGYFHTKTTPIKRVLSGVGIPRRTQTGKCRIDEMYFETIDTEHKAYFLGLLFADGCVFKSRSGSFGIRLELVKRDGELVEKFKEETQATYKLSLKQTKNENWDDKVGITITNDKFTQHLMSKGCVPNKGTICKIPFNRLPTEMVRHFIRGYFDGDGCLTYTDKHYVYPNVNLCVSKIFGDQLRNYLLELDIKSSIRHKKSGIYSISVEKRQAMKFLIWTYEPSLVKLSRKHNRYLFFRSYFDNNDRGKQARNKRSSAWTSFLKSEQFARK